MFLNPFTFNRKYGAALNIISARLSFERLSEKEKVLTLNTMAMIETDAINREVTIKEIIEDYNYIEFHLLLALALANIHVPPAYGVGFWEKFKNPHLDGIGCEPVLEVELEKYTKETGMVSPDIKDMSIFKSIAAHI